MRIIHFSDFHLKRDQIGRAETLVKRMLEAIMPLHHQKPVDLIVFSGDLIDKAGELFETPKMENGFKKFKELVIDEMTTKLGLPLNRFIFVPGNHDVNESLESKDEDTILTEKLKTHRDIDILMHQSDVADRVPRIKEYNEFRDYYWNNYRGDAEVEKTPFQMGVKLNIGGWKVGINCLNTAWRCYKSSTDYGKIVLGKTQITDMRDFFEDCHIKLVVGHHPLSAMSHFEVKDLASIMANRCDVYFYGHSHEDDGRMEGRPEGSCFFFNAPGTKSDNISADVPYNNGFRVIDFELGERYVEAQRFLQGVDEDFKQDKNYGNDGVWHCNIPGSTIIKPIAISLLLQKREIGFLDCPATDDCIWKLRNTDKKIIQFVALSGLGKTRILYEAFKDKKDAPNYYYREFSDNETGLLYDIDDILRSHIGQEGVIILDNCPNGIMEKAAALLDEYDTNFRIIGVNNEYYDRKNLTVKDAEPILLTQDGMRQRVAEYVEQQIPVVRGDTTFRDQIIHLSDGFPGMAIELVKAFHENKSVDSHRVDSLVKRMLKFEPGAEKDQEVAMRSLALFQPFPYSGIYKNAYIFIRNNERITPLYHKSEEEKRHIFWQVVNRYEGALVEVSECWLNVRPFPLAVWLVSKWFEADNDEERMNGIINDIGQLEEGLRGVVMDSLCKRLEYMQDSADAQDMIARLTNNGNAPFCNEKVVCSDLGSRLFLAMSPVNPVAIASCFYKVLFQKDIDWLRQNLCGETRRNIIWALEKLCFDKEGYTKAVWVLARLAVAENETYANNASGQLSQLFHVILPGTMATLDERLNTLERLRTAGEEYKQTTLNCYDSAFDSGHFGRDGSGAQFGLERKEDYYPKTNKEIVVYWLRCRDLLSDWIDIDASITDGVSIIIINHLLQWGFDGMVERMYPLIEKVANLKNYQWEELYATIIKIKRNRLNYYSEEFQQKFEQLKEAVRPKTFKQKLKDARQEVYNKELTTAQMINFERQLFTPLAKEFVDGRYYGEKEEVRLIVEDDEYLDMGFSMALRDVMSAEQVEKLLSIVLDIIFEREGNDFRSGFVFRFCYDFREHEAVKKFFAEIVASGREELYIRFLAHCETEQLSSLDQLIKDISDGVVEESGIDIYLGYVTAYTKEQIVAILKRCIEMFPTHVPAMMDFVIRRQFNVSFYHETDVLQIIKSLVLRYPSNSDRNRLDYEYSRFVSNLLENTHDEEFAVAVAKKVIDAYNSEYLHDKFEGVFSVLLTQYTDAIWDSFVDAFVSEEQPGFYVQVRNEIGCGFSFGTGPLFSLGDDRIKTMCMDYPDKAPARISEIIPVFYPSSPKSIGFQEQVAAERFSDLFLWLLDEFGDNKDVLSGLHANLGSYSWTGSVIPLIVEKQSCFEQIKNHKRPEVHAWVEKCLEELEREYANEKSHEDYMRLRYS